MTEFPSRYDHKESEPKIYGLWEKSGYFNPDNLADGKLPTTDSKKKKLSAISHKPFAIIMPPPNANGLLHMGHAFEVALQDLMTRFWRMRGRKTLWLPGADHAGFETQVVFDKKLDKDGKNRLDMPREEVYKAIWNFTQENKKAMEKQLRQLGASCDWSREKFTLDPDIVREVQKTFVKLHEDGLIYRDLRVINWCPKHKTALSDLEVKYAERRDPLYYIKYGPLALATVRPETKFGDTALAVNPKDERYKKYIGKEIEARGVLGPLKFKIVADEAVDPSFGTGVVKVTPAHDPADFEIWQRHKNEIGGPKVIIDENGRLTGDVGKFAGLKIAEAREKVTEEMRRLGILEKIDPEYVHQVATCYKCGTTLEPIPKMQWWVKMQPLAKPAIEAVKKKKIKIIPERFEKIYLNWLLNIRDWNISRQIVWGIRIPAWFCLGCGEPKINPEIKSRWFIVRHGETDWNKEGRTQGHSDSNLSEDGIKQAESAAEILAGEKIDLIISSDLGRCRQTAEIIAKKTGAEVVLDGNLRERNLGVAEGQLKEEWHKKYPDHSKDYDARPPGGESFRELQERVWRAFGEHKNRHGHKNIVLVSHSGAIRTLTGKLRRLEFLEMSVFAPKNSQIIELSISLPCQCGSDIYEQDPDVFDTWFSSGQWPFLTLGFRGSEREASSAKGGSSSDFKTFYPTDVMDPAYEILFFWVARMVMLGLYRTGKVPFKTVLLHGLVRDKDKQKMSKSKGNVVDPLGVAEIYGADAVRMALISGTAPGNDPTISEEKIRGYRNFATKLWNVARFIQTNKPANGGRPGLGEPRRGGRRMDGDGTHGGYVAELAAVKKEVASHAERFEFHLAAEKIYHYVWHTLADKIIEAEKATLKGGGAQKKSESYALLEHLLLESIKMLHPFMPFVTEEIYQKFRPGKLLMVEKW